MTVRQVFYQLVSQGVIDKTEAEYKGTVVRLLTDMRIGGELPFKSIADNTFSSLEEALRITAEFGLPTRPTKASDARSRGFVGESVEVDAIAPAELRALVHNAIEQHINKRALRALQIAERSEREITSMLVAREFG